MNSHLSTIPGPQNSRQYNSINSEYQDEVDVILRCTKYIMQNVSSLEQNIENQTSNLWLDAMIANSKALLGSIRKLQDKSSYEETKASNKARQDYDLIWNRRQNKARSALPKSRRRVKANNEQLRCHSCNISETPEWRRGPDGARTLCNACGLRKIQKLVYEKKIPLATDHPLPADYAKLSKNKTAHTFPNRSRTSAWEISSIARFEQSYRHAEHRP